MGGFGLSNGTTEATQLGVTVRNGQLVWMVLA